MSAFGRYVVLLVLSAVTLAVGCASVLGVDKQYALGDASTIEPNDAGGAARSLLCALDGAAACDLRTQECCMGKDYSLACASSALSDPCPEGTDIRCAQPSDCASGVCCLTLDTANDILGSACGTSCSAPNGEVELCSPGGPCASGTCTVLTVDPVPPIHNPWFYACK